MRVRFIVNGEECVAWDMPMPPRIGERVFVRPEGLPGSVWCRVYDVGYEQERYAEVYLSEIAKFDQPVAEPQPQNEKAGA